MDRKRMPESETPVEAERGEGDYARKRRKEQHSYPENEGLLEKKTRAADPADSVEGEDLENAREAAAQRGRAG